MKNRLTLVFCLLLGTSAFVKAQLPDGSIAPNFTRTDINGVTHTLYDYLNDGKMVILKFSATWCGPCWNYMQTGALETVWEDHGPDGDNTVMIFYIESDQNTGMADLLGQTPSSQGNWVAALPFPIIDLQVGQNEDNIYQVAYYPTLYAICSDKTVWELGQVPAFTWSNYIQSCTLEGSVDYVEDAVCFGDGSIGIESSGGVAPVSFVWNTGATGPILNNIGAGTYTVTITEAGGKWVKINNIIVDGTDEPIEVDSEVQEPECFGAPTGSIDIEVVGGTPGYEYDWSNGSSGEDLPAVIAGIYSVIITDENGCTSVQSYTLEQPDEIEVDAELTPDYCSQENGSITLAIEGGTGDYIISASEGNVSGNQIINLPSGPVTAIVEDENGCVWEQDFAIGYVPSPEVDIFQGPDLNCIQLTTTLQGIPSGGSGDFSYQWTTADGHIVSGAYNQTVTINEPGTYNLFMLDYETNCETESSYLVTAEIVPPLVNAGIDLPITCEANQPVIQGSGDPLNSITWTTTNGNIVSGGNTYTPVVNAPGTYFINVVNSQTNCPNVDSVEIINQLNPATAVFQTMTNSLTLFTTDASTGSNVTGWSWTFGDGNSSSEQSPVHTYAASGIYQVCLTVQNGCGPNQSCSQVEVIFTGSILSLDVEVGNVLCYGDSSGNITLVAGGGSGIYTYAWTGPNGVTYNTPSINGVIAGSYSVLVSDDQGNTIIGNYTVLQPQELLITTSTVVNNLCFGETNGSVIVELTGGVSPYTYSWNGSPAQPLNTINQLPAGIYNVIITDANGCVLLAEYTVEEPGVINAQSTVTNALCFGDANGAASLAVSGGVSPYSYLWTSSGNQNSESTGLAAGNYLVQVTDANGCLMNVDVVVGQPDQIGVNVTEIKDASGPGLNNGSITVQVTGGTEPYNVTWNNGLTGQSIQDLSPGEYTYTIVDSHGCMFASASPIVVGQSVATNEPNEPAFISINPNPSNGKVVIQWKEINATNSSISIMTIDGRKVDSFELQAGEGILDLNYLNLSEGLYIVLLTHREKVFPYKLIVL